MALQTWPSSFLCLKNYCLLNFLYLCCNLLRHPFHVLIVFQIKAKNSLSHTQLLSELSLQYIFSDFWFSSILSTNHQKYYVLFVDHYTRYSWLYPLQRKSELKDIFQAFKPLVENRFNSKICTLYTDNGGEYLALRKYLSEHGISHLTTPPHTPEHNGLSEHKHRHIVETGLALLSTMYVPKTYWPHAYLCALAPVSIS